MIIEMTIFLSSRSLLHSSQGSQSHLFVYAAEKAGMANTDKERIKQTIYEMSKGSAYLENEQRKAAQVRNIRRDSVLRLMTTRRCGCAVCECRRDWSARACCMNVGATGTRVSV